MESGSADFATIDADLLLEQVAQALDALFAKVYESITRIELIAISCFWHSLVGVDETGRATTPVFGWADSRNRHQLALRSRSNWTKLKFMPALDAAFIPATGRQNYSDCEMTNQKFSDNEPPSSPLPNI